jgi:predicted RNA-binding Zn-ribbon protein involved in translation (DUF1610 family)
MCNWQNQEEYYDTSCGKGFFFDTGNLKENEFKFCPYCGEAIIEINDSDGNSEVTHDR